LKEPGEVTLLCDQAGNIQIETVKGDQDGV